MSEALDPPSTLHTKLAIGWSGLVTSAYFIVFILKRIELNSSKTKTQSRRRKFLQELGNETKFQVSIQASNSNDSSGNSSVVDFSQMKEEADDGKSLTSSATMTTLDSPGHSSEFEAQVHDMAQNPHEFIGPSSSYEQLGNGDTKFIRTKLNLEEKLVLYVMVCILLFLVYLLLVYLPSGATASLFGTLCIAGIMFKTQIANELRRGRYDRLAAIATLIIFAASFLSLITYSEIGIREGTIYEGPARIVGYDTSIYEKESGSGDFKTEATRMDLEVAWGGAWGCPDYNGVECRAFVSGALCEADIDRRRHLQQSSNTTIAINASNSSDIEDSDSAAMEELEKEVEELKKENKELKKENTGLDEAVSEENKELHTAENAVEIYSENLEDEEETAEYYKEEAVEEAVDLIYEAGEVLEEEVVAEYYSAVASEEAYEIIDAYEELGDETLGEEIVLEIEDENYEYYTEVLDNVDAAIEEEIDNIESVTDFSDAQNVDEDIGEVIVEAINDDDDAGDIDDVELEEEESYIEEVEAEKGEEEGEIIEDDEYKSAYSNPSNYYYDSYSFDDDAFEDDWWSSSWTDVWGEYACNDIFDSDLAGKSYDIDEAPGDDEWPFVNVYGSCNRCEAYLVDYYSTEHFNMIKEYQIHARNYALCGVVGLVVTLALAMRQYLNPAEENEIGLLMNEGGQVV